MITGSECSELAGSLASLPACLRPPQHLRRVGVPPGQPVLSARLLYSCSVCENMHGLDKTKLVAESIHASIDWIERVIKEVG